MKRSQMMSWLSPEYKSECGALQVGCFYNLAASLCTFHRLQRFVKWGGALVAFQVWLFLRCEETPTFAKILYVSRVFYNEEVIGPHFVVRCFSIDSRERVQNCD